MRFTRKSVTAIIIIAMFVSGGTGSFAYCEKDPGLEYIRASEKFVRQLPPSAFNIDCFKGLYYSDKGDIDKMTVNGKQFAQKTTNLCLSFIDFNATGIKTSCTMDSTNKIIKFNASMDIGDKEQYAEAVSEAEKIAADIRSKDLSDRKMVETVNQYLIDHVSYPKVVNEKNKSLWSAYGALIKGEAVCQGYVMAFNLIMKKLSIPVLNIYGSADGGRHVWNTVLVDGKWLYVDVTFNDPVISGRKPGNAEMERLSKRYLLLDEKEFYAMNVHKRDPDLNEDIARDTFYRNRTENQANLLRSSGLFLGDKAGFRLNDRLTRAEMAVMLTRITGGITYIQSNPSYYIKTCKDAFRDVPEWAMPYVGYCYDKGLVVGMGDSVYGSSGMAKKLDYCTVLLRAKGIMTDYTYDTSDKKAVEQGYLTFARAAFSDLTRGDVAAMTCAFYGL